MGYLKCDKCGGYYELQPGESLADFGSCECGGNLNYVENIENENVNFPPSKNKNLIIINWKLIAIAIIVCFILQVFISFILTMIGLPMITISILGNYILPLLIGMYVGFSVNLNPKNGLINGLIIGFTAGILNLIVGVVLYVFIGYGALSKLLSVLIILILVFGIGGSIGGIWRNQQLKNPL